MSIPLLSPQLLAPGFPSSSVELRTLRSAQAGLRPDGKGHDSGRLRKVANEFEAQLLGSWLQSLQQTYSIGAGDEDPPTGENYRYLGTQALATSLAQQGGIGIARMLLHSLQLSEAKNSSPRANVTAVTADSNQ